MVKVYEEECLRMDLCNIIYEEPPYLENFKNKKGEKMKQIITLVSLFLVLVSSNTFGATNSTVIQVSINSVSGGGYIVFSSDVATMDCGGGATLTHLAFDTNTVGGKAVYSAALVAYSTGRTVFVNTINSCAPWQLNVQRINGLVLQQ